MKKSYLFVIALLIQSVFSQERVFSFHLEVKNSKKVLNLSTFETFPCMGFGIKTRQLVYHDTLIIDILGYKKPAPCFSALEIAQERIPLLEIKTDTFAIKFRWLREEDIWKVTSRKTTFTIEDIKSTFTSCAE